MTTTFPVARWELCQVIEMMATDKSNDWSEEIDTLERIEAAIWERENAK